LFTWAGWPLLLAGAWGLIIALLLLLFTESIYLTLGVRIPVEVPRALIPSIQAVIFALIHYFARPLLIQSAVMIGLGGMAILGGVITKRFGEDRASSSHDPSTRLSAEEPPRQSQSEPPPITQKSDPEDDDSPTGMFG
jgi:hypothetical protein